MARYSAQLPNHYMQGSPGCSASASALHYPFDISFTRTCSYSSCIATSQAMATGKGDNSPFGCPVRSLTWYVIQLQLYRSAFIVAGPALGATSSFHRALAPCIHLTLAKRLKPSSCRPLDPSQVRQSSLHAWPKAGEGRACDRRIDV